LGVLGFTPTLGQNGVATNDLKKTSHAWIVQNQQHPNMTY
jgi:hypothetical protein